MTLTQWIKAEALQLGFFSVGIARATFLEKEAKDLEIWLSENRNGEMAYMENYFDKRTDPRLLVEGAKSVITVLHNYLPDATYQQPEDAPKISRYAWGLDYHHVLKQKLYTLLEGIKSRTSDSIAAGVYVDSAPVMDKAWAQKGGLGWIGKHTNLIVPHAGSYFFIGEIILDVALSYDNPIRDMCGTCTRCIDACPTDALAPYEIDARKCISYLTIELKNQTPTHLQSQMEGWAYGCDICQEVCPWNRFAKAHTGEEFKPLDFILQYTEADWQNVDKSTFKKLTKRSAMSRVKWEKMKENVAIAKNNQP